MSELIFIYNQNPLKIQYKENDLIKDIIERFCLKAGVKSSDLHFLSNGNIINPNNKIEDEFKSDLKNKSIIKILVNSNNEKNKIQNNKISTELICPKCNDNEPCQIEINDYKMTFSSCKNGHITKDISFSDIKNNLKVDESKIICKSCNNNNKASTFNNQFYICISCKKYLCPICHSSHDKKHDIIDFNQKNYICFNHNEKFSSFCKNCKINLCMECEAEHKDKQNLIYFRDILPNKVQLKTNLNELRTKIDKYEEKINEIKNIFDKIIASLEMYYEINNNLLNDYENKKKNYQLLNNLNVSEKYNSVIIKDINNIIKTDEFFEIIKNSMSIINKMDIKYIGKSIKPISGKEINDSQKEEIDKSIYINQYSKNIKKLYENLVENDKEIPNNSGIKYEKLIYIGMLAEQFSLYDDNVYFLKELIKTRKKIMNRDERNFFTASCKNSISNYRSAIRTVLTYENREKKKHNSPYLSYIKEYRNIVENVFYEKCHEIIKFVEEYIVKKDNFEDYDVEGKVYFFKMLGDYHKYLCECDTFKTKEINKTKFYYNKAIELSKNLQITNCIYLGVFLNYSVFVNEILSEKKKSIELAKSTIEKFKKEEKNLNKEDDNVKDALSIINLMEINLGNWEQ